MLNFPPAIIRWLDLLRTTQLGMSRGAFETEVEGQPAYCALGFLCLANQKPRYVKGPNGGPIANWEYCNEFFTPYVVSAIWHRWDNPHLTPTAREFADWLEPFLAPHFLVSPYEPT